MIDNQVLRQMSTWAGFVGIITIISGVLSCITIVGIIPGIISIILGLKLRSAKKYSDEILVNPDLSMQDGKMNLLLSDISSYFKIQGILIIIALVIIALFILFAISSRLIGASWFSPFYF